MGMGRSAGQKCCLASIWRQHFRLTLVVTVTLVLHMQGVSRGDFWTSDDARHALDGVFILDFFRDLPWSHPIDYLIQYYAKYPALGIGNYPPFYACIEAMVFAVAGISFTSAKATVVLFSVLASWAWFRLIRDAYDDGVALWSTLLLVTSPFIVSHAKSVMLEMPTLAMVIMSVALVYDLVAQKAHSRLIPLGVCTLLAILTKQTAIFLLPIILLYLGISRRYVLMLTKSHGLVAGVFLLLLLPLVGLTISFGDMHIRQIFGTAEFLTRHSVWYHLSFYLVDWLKNSWYTTLASLLFLFHLSITRKTISKQNQLFIIWIVVFYLVFSAVNVKTSRYSYFAIPPLTLFAVLGVRELLGCCQLARFMPVVLLLPVCVQTSQSYRLTHHENSSYREAAEFIMAGPADAVLFHGDGVGTGSFVFHIRALDVERKMVVYRADKVLASAAMDSRSQLEEYVHTVDAVAQLCDSLGIQYFVVARDHFDVNAYKLLHALVASEQFVQEIGFFQGRGKRAQYLDVYKKKTKPSVTATRVVMKLPIAGVKIDVSLTELTKFYTPADNRVVKN